MEYVRLGGSGLQVSRICLGTMTFGLQVDEERSRAILDYSADKGVTFLDAADVYPLGGDLTTVGRTEEILGRWLAETKPYRLSETEWSELIASRLVRGRHLRAA